MNRCPITYSPCGEDRYSEKGLRLLAPGISNLKILDYSSEELRIEAFRRASKMSIQGVQPKLSAILNQKDEKFEITDKGGKYILKPQHQYYYQMPENEDLTMRLAEIIDLEIPFHGLIWAKDNSLTYFIKRFDRRGQNGKIPVEDFAQLGGLTRDTKYDYSMEKMVNLINKYCTFPAIENAKLFKMTLFNFLVGNEDMHVKNFSIINRDNRIELSPCYDLLNSTIEFTKQEEEIALPVRGKKRNLTEGILIDYFGKEKCELTTKVIDNILESISSAIPDWLNLINISFLNADMKTRYIELLNMRSGILKIR